MTCIRAVPSVLLALAIIVHAAAGPAAGAPLDVLTMGDSITRGFDAEGDGSSVDADGEIRGGWRAPLYVNLLERGFEVDYHGRADTGPDNVEVHGSVVPFDGQHEGYNGWHIDETFEETISDGRHGFLEELPAMFDTANGGTDAAVLDYVIVGVGVNDLIRDDSINLDPSDPDFTPNRLNNLVHEIKQHLDSAGNTTARLLVSNVLPVRDEFTGFSNVNEPYGDELREDIEYFNDFFADFFDLSGNHLALEGVQMLDAYSVIMADLEAYISDEQADGRPDYLHPTPAGYQALADMYAAVVPEPGTLALLAAGAGLIACRPRRRRAA